MTSEENKKLQQQIGIPYSEFLIWVDQNSPKGWPVEDTHTLLSFMGFVMFRQLQLTLPHLTLEQCDQAFFGDDNGGDELISLIRAENGLTVN